MNRFNRLLAVVVLVLTCCTLLAGCPNAALIEALAKDNANVCFSTWVGVGGGAITPIPTVPIMGGVGYMIFGRTNRDDATLTVTNDSCTITTGKRWTLVPLEESAPAHGGVVK